MQSSELDVFVCFKSKQPSCAEMLIRDDQSRSADVVRELRDQRLGATEIAKRLNIGRASVDRAQATC